MADLINIPAPATPVVLTPIQQRVNRGMSEMNLIYMNMQRLYESIWNQIWGGTNDPQAELNGWKNAVRLLDLMKKMANFLTTANYTPPGIPAGFKVTPNADGLTVTVTKS
jgi:hypothetical protein